jgi:hypothetical protein
MTIEGRRRFLVAPRIRTRQADRAIREELIRLGVDSVIPLALDGASPRRARVTMRTAVVTTGFPAPSAGG